MALCVDVITGDNLVAMIKLNIPSSFPVLDKGVNGFVKAVLKNLNGNKMKVLRIWGHAYLGDNGNLIFGNDNLKSENVEGFRADLALLMPCFESNGRVELRGCQAAKGNGKEMMKKLASIWNVNVYGSSISQELIMWYPPVFLATPAGTFTETKGIEVWNEKCTQ